jgi:hypothetical protein
LNQLHTTYLRKQNGIFSHFMPQQPVFCNPQKSAIVFSGPPEAVASLWRIGLIYFELAGALTAKAFHGQEFALARWVFMRGTPRRVYGVEEMVN